MSEGASSTERALALVLRLRGVERDRALRALAAARAEEHRLASVRDAAAQKLNQARIHADGARRALVKRVGPAEWLLTFARCKVAELEESGTHSEAAEAELSAAGDASRARAHGLSTAMARWTAVDTRLATIRRAGRAAAEERVEDSST